MSKLRRNRKESKPYIKVFLVGVGRCLLDPETGVPLTVRLRPFTTKQIIKSKEMIGLIQKLQDRDLIENNKLRAKALVESQVQKMDIAEQLKLIQEVLDVSAFMLKEFAVDAGYEIPDSKEPVVFEKVKFVDTEREANELNDKTELEVEQGIISEKQAITYFAIEEVDEAELMRLSENIKELAKSLQDSDEVKVEIEPDVEGGEVEEVTLKDLNSFPTNLGGNLMEDGGR